MRSLLALIVCVTMLTSLAGCVRTYVYEKERVDQKIAGNRGVIMGDVPPAQTPEFPPTRTIIGVDVEIPTLKEVAGKTKKALPKAKKREEDSDKELWGNRGNFSGTPQREETYPYSGERVEKETVVEKADVIKFPRVERKTLQPVRRSSIKKTEDMLYTVKEGDTLSAIAARSDIYDDAGQWKKIYDANRGTISDPSRVYPGQVLSIPVGVEAEERKGSRAK